MTSQAATAERISIASEAKLRLFVQLLARLREVDNYDAARAIRDDLTQWAPWIINLHVWDELYDALSSTEKREKFRQLLEETDQSLKRVLKRKDGGVPTELFGDVSEDVRMLGTYA